ncbi:MAG: ABC transporter substrate-binding protein [Pseudomonadota bacterium]
MRKVSAVLLCLAFFACAKQGARTDGEKILNYAFGADIKGFDPATQNDEYTSIAVHQVYEGLLRYSYLKRPYQLEPQLAAAMPSISKDGRTYTFQLRPGVFFHDDPVFGGKPRPLRSSDVVYSLERLRDPKLQGPNTWVFEGRIERISAPDDATVVVKLTRPYRQFLYVLAMSATKIVAKEVVEKYGAEFLNHAVGTGPFRLKEWRRGQKITFVRNRNHWPDTYPSEGTEEDRAAGLLSSAGKPIPFVDSVVIWIYTESQPRWLNFMRGNLDLAGIPKESYDAVFTDKGEVREEIRKRGMAVTRSDGVNTLFFGFNLDDPILGRNRFLRQAISCAIDRESMIRLFYNNRGVIANSLIPPGFVGFDPNVKDPNGFNPARAKELMKKATERYHELGGKGEIPTIQLELINSTTSRQMVESLIRDLATIGLKIEMNVKTWPQLQERLAKRQAQFFWAGGWQADYPDPENMLQILYSKNASPGPNSTNFKNAEYDRLYERMRDLPDGPERLAVIARMVQIGHAETPMALFSHLIGYGIRQPWLKNYKPNPISQGNFEYLDIAK